MERNVRYVWIGAVFFIILILMIMFVLWLNRFELDSAKYTRYYAFSADEVSGVGTNTPIRYKGISVGRVQSVSFKDMKSGIIAIEMLVDSNLEIKQNAKVVVASQGLAGANYLSLIQGEGEILQADESGNKVIMLDKGGLDKILGKAGEISEDITALLANLNRTFNEENLNNLTEMIKELRSSTNSLASLSSQMDKNMKNGEYNVREILSPTLLQLQGSLQDMSRFFNTATRFVDKVDKNPYDSLFGKQNTESKGSK